MPTITIGTQTDLPKMVSIGIQTINPTPQKYKKARRYSVGGDTLLSLSHNIKTSHSKLSNFTTHSQTNSKKTSFNVDSKNEKRFLNSVSNSSEPKFVFPPDKTERSFTQLRSLLQEIELCLTTYSDQFTLKIPPSEAGKGEVELNFNNEFVKNLEISVDATVYFPYDYPNIPLEINLKDFGGITLKQAENLIAILKEKSAFMSKMREESLFEIITLGVGWIEEVEDSQQKAQKRKNLFEIRLEKEEKKRIEQEEKMKEISLKKKEDELLELERKRQNAKERFMYLHDDISNAKIKNKKSSIWVEKIKKKVIKMKNEDLMQDNDDRTILSANSGHENLQLRKASSLNSERKDSNFGLPEKEFGSMISPINQKKISDGKVVSRFNNDFEFVSLLGQGGFGSVFKARNILDGNNYAIKRMILDYNYPDNVKKLLSEVKLLSQFNHIHIVRYYQAWTEDMTEEEAREFLGGEDDEDESYYFEEEDIGEDGDSNEDDGNHGDIEDKFELQINLDDENKYKEEDTYIENKNFSFGLENQGIKEIKFSEFGLQLEREKSKQTESEKDKQTEEEIKEEDSEKEKEESSDNNSKSSNNSSSSGSSSSDSGDDSESKSSWDVYSEDEKNKDEPVGGEENNSKETPVEGIKEDIISEKKSIKSQKSSKNGESIKKKNHNMKFLYIQMECCEVQTLKEVINSGVLSRNPQLFKNLLTQILEALDYVHKQNLIHRDLKPANIFLDKKFNVKLGDFGLATKGVVKGNKDSKQPDLVKGNSIIMMMDEVKSIQSNKLPILIFK